MSESVHRGAACVGGLMAIAIVVLLNAQDFSREPPTDDADGMAVALIMTGVAIWFLGRGQREPAVQIVRSLAIGAAVGAALVGLVSVVYDPFA